MAREGSTRADTGQALLVADAYALSGDIGRCCYAAVPSAREAPTVACRVQM